MLLIPYDKIELTTDKTPQQIKHILDKTIAASGIKNLRYWNKELIEGKLFEGDTTENWFKIRRLVRYWNVCLPIITGIVSHEEKTNVKIKFRMTVLDEIILLMFFVGLVLSVLSFIFPTPNIEMMVKIEAGIVFALGVGVMFFLYKSEVSKAKTILSELIEKKHPHKENT